MTPDRHQAELALIGCVIEKPELSIMVKSEWLEDLRLGELLLKIVALDREGVSIDAATIVSRGGDYALVMDCQAQCPSPASFPYWLEIIVELAEKDRLRNAAQHFLAVLPNSNGSLQTIISQMENALGKPIGSQSKTLTPKDCADGLHNHLEARFNLQGKRSGLQTGFERLDYYTDGLQFGEVTVLAARPSIGKTAIACNIVERVCLRDRLPTLFLSLEMSSPALCRRLLSAYERVPMENLKSGKLCEDDFVRISRFNKLLRESPLYIREAFGGMSGGEAAAIIRRGVRRKGIKFVVLDYLQKLKADAKHEKRTYEVAEASGVMVNAVKETGVAFLCLAQLNRESEKEKGRMPRISDLADSGQIERDADNVLLLHRNRDKTPNEAALIVGKQRDGETGCVSLYFDGKFCRFSTMERTEPTNPQSKDP